jgi:RNA polymerase sigma-70 factor (ECF subfamily)
MTTAPDLPLRGQPAPLPYGLTSYGEPAYAEPVRPPLALVPPARESDDPSVDLTDPGAFDDALSRAIPRLRRYASRRLFDAHEAEEVVQEAMLRAFQHREELATEDDLMAWLTVVTGRLTIDRLRVRGRMTPVAELPAGARTGRDTADVVVARDEARIALDALEAMPARQASVLWAREVEGMSYDDIGERYGLSEPTVRSLLHRARRTLRREYSERGGTLPTMGLVALAPWLRGLRFAGRVRDVARRGGSAAAVAATGLAITAVAPLWGSAHAPAERAVPPMHGIVAKAHETDVRSTSAPAAAAATPVHPVSSTHLATAPPAGGMTKIGNFHTSCGSHQVRVNCAAPKGNTLFVIVPGPVKAPVGNGNAVGVSTNDISCKPVPETALTHCDPATKDQP